MKEVSVYGIKPKKNCEGSISISHLDDEQFFALMDEIMETLELFKRWDK